MNLANPTPRRRVRLVSACFAGGDAGTEAHDGCLQLALLAKEKSVAGLTGTQPNPPPPPQKKKKTIWVGLSRGILFFTTKKKEEK